MPTHYAVLIKRSDDEKVMEYYFPDFDFAHTVTEEDIYSLSEDTAGALQQHLASHYQHRPIPFPRSLQQHEKVMIAGLKDFWIQCQIEDANYIKVCERFLPPFGIFSSIMTAATMAVIDFATTSTLINSDAGIGLGVCGALFSGVMAIIIYYYSGASEISKIIGRKLDHAHLLLKCEQPEQTNRSAHCRYQVARFMSKCSVTVIPMATTLFTSHSHYSQVISVIDNDIEENNSTLAAALKIIALIMIIFSSYSKFVFQLSFMPLIYEALDNCIGGRMSGFVGRRSLPPQSRTFSMRLTSYSELGSNNS